MSQVVSLRLPDETAERLKITARRSGRTVNEAASRSIEEWLRQEEFADIEFRNFNGERLACLKGSIPVWELIMIAKGYTMDADKTSSHLSLPLRRVKAAFHYYEVYAQEVDQAISDNAAMSFDVLKRMLPQIRETIIPRSVLDGESDD